MKRLLIIATLFGLFATGALGQKDKSAQLLKIRESYNKVSAEIKKIESNPEAASQSYLAVNELVVNKLNRSWPAVGNYKVTFRFYYKQTGEEPYPNHLVKVTMSMKTSAREYYKEYFYDEFEKPAFVFSKGSDVPEQRFYFSGGVLIEAKGKFDGASHNSSPLVDQIRKEASNLLKSFKLTL